MRIADEFLQCVVYIYPDEESRGRESGQEAAAFLCILNGVMVSKGVLAILW